MSIVKNFIYVASVEDDGIDIWLTVRAPYPVKSNLTVRLESGSHGDTVNVFMPAGAQETHTVIPARSGATAFEVSFVEPVSDEYYKYYPLNMIQLD